MEKMKISSQDVEKLIDKCISDLGDKLTQEEYDDCFYNCISNILDNTNIPPQYEMNVVQKIIEFVRKYKYKPEDTEITKKAKTTDEALKLLQRIKNSFDLDKTNHLSKHACLLSLYKLCTRLTVCLYVHGLSSGGAERQVASLAKTLDSIGINVILLCDSLSDHEAHYLYMLDGTAVRPRIYTANIEKQAALAAGSRSSKKLPEIFNELKKQEPNTIQLLLRAGYINLLAADIVHCFLDHTNVSGGCSSLLAGIKGIVLSGRNLNPKTIGLGWDIDTYDRYKYLSTKPNVIFENNSLAGARSYEEWLDLPAGQIQVSHNGIDPSWFDFNMSKREEIRKSLGCNDDTLAVLSLKRDDHRNKNAEGILKVAEKIKGSHPNIHFYIAGIGMDEESDMGRWKKERGLEKTVHLLGVRKDVPDLLAASDVFLLTSYVEGLPNAIMESMAVGLPIVSSDAGGVPELVRHEIDGFVHKAGDEESMVTSLLLLYSDKELRKKLGNNAKNRITEHFSLQKLAERALEKYIYLMDK